MRRTRRVGLPPCRSPLPLVALIHVHVESGAPRAQRAVPGTHQTTRHAHDHVAGPLVCSSSYLRCAAAADIVVVWRAHKRLTVFPRARRARNPRPPTPRGGCARFPGATARPRRMAPRRQGRATARHTNVRGRGVGSARTSRDRPPLLSGGRLAARRGRLAAHARGVARGRTASWSLSVEHDARHDRADERALQRRR